MPPHNRTHRQQRWVQLRVLGPMLSLICIHLTTVSLATKINHTDVQNDAASKQIARYFHLHTKQLLLEQTPWHHLAFDETDPPSEAGNIFQKYIQLTEYATYGMSYHWKQASFPSWEERFQNPRKDPLMFPKRTELFRFPFLK